MLRQNENFEGVLNEFSFSEAERRLSKTPTDSEKRLRPLKKKKKKSDLETSLKTKAHLE